MDLKHFASFDLNSIHNELEELGGRLKGSLDSWIKDKAASLQDAADCLSVLTGELSGLFERSEHLFVRVIDIGGRQNSGYPLTLRYGTYAFDLSERPTNSFSEGGFSLQGKYRVFVIMERIGG